MIKRLARWLRRSAEDAQADEIVSLFHDVGYLGKRAPTSPRAIRRLSDAHLNEWIALKPGGYSQVALERELRRREAWAAPAGRAFWISIGSFIVAAIALGVSVFKVG